MGKDCQKVAVKITHSSRKKVCAQGLVEPHSESTLGTCGDEGVEGDCIGEAALMMHLVEQLQCELPLSCLFACRDEAAVSDDTPLTTLVHHLLKHFHDLQDSWQ